MVNVVAFKNPLSPESETWRLDYGKTYREILDGLECGRSAMIFCDDFRVLPYDWDDVPHEGAIVLIKMVPEGFAVIGSIFITSLVIEFIGLGIDYTVNGDNSIVHKLGLDQHNQSVKDTSTTTRPGIKGASNSLGSWGAIPVILGKHLITPKYAGNPYTEISGADGADQFLHLAFIIGYGPLSISQIKIGENLLASNVADVRTGAITVDGILAGSDIQVEIRQDSADMTYYPKRVTEDQFEIQMKSPLGTPTYLYRVTAPGCTKIEADFQFPNGLIAYDESGSPSNAGVHFRAEYRIAGSGKAWNLATILIDTTLSKQLKQTGRYSYSSGPVAANQYEVRAYRCADSPDSTDDKVRDAIYWTALRSTIAEAPVSAAAANNVCAKVVRLSMRIKASTAINGTIGSINMLAQALITVYSGSGSGAAQWTAVAATSNPAAEALYLLRGAPNPRIVADSLIDWPAFEELYTWAATKPNSCNGLLDSQATLRESVGKVLAAGRASLSMRGPVYSLVHDVAKSTPSQLFTPRNSYDFVASKAFADLPHGFRLSFINAGAGYQIDECMILADGYVYDIYNDGVTRDARGAAHNPGDAYLTKVYVLASKFESIDRWGITDYNEAFREGRYMLATRYLRPEVYSIKADFERPKQGFFLIDHKRKEKTVTAPIFLS